MAAEQGWVVILRDKRLRNRPAETAALREHPLCVLVLTSAGQLRVWDQLRLLLRYWDKIEELVENEPPPWIAAVTKQGIKRRSYPDVPDDE